MDVEFELAMKISRRDIRLLLLYEFHLGRKAMKTISNTYGAMGKDIRVVRTVQHWFDQFKHGNFEFDDLSHHYRWI